MNDLPKTLQIKPLQDLHTAHGVHAVLAMAAVPAVALRLLRTMSDAIPKEKVVTASVRYRVGVIVERMENRKRLVVTPCTECK